MEAPQVGRSPEELSAAIEEIFEKYDATETGLACRTCKGKINFAACAVSVHETAPGGICAGFGNVIRFPLPYCPKCEGKPERTATCVHTGRLEAIFGGSIEDDARLKSA